MSVMIRGMKMPKSCSECRMQTDSGFCSAMPKEFCGYADEQNRPDWCPLVDLGKHGRLIDVDEFKADYGMKDDCADCDKELRNKSKSCEYDIIYSKMDFCGWLDNAPVVIEAEGE